MAAPRVPQHFCQRSADAAEAMTDPDGERLRESLVDR